MMSKEKRRVPKLRFPGFTEDWEQRKLSDILKVNSGKDYKHLEQGDIPVYGTGGYMLSVNESLSNIDAIGIGRKGTIDKPQYLKAPFWTVDTLFYLTALDKHSILFLYYLMQLMPWKKFDESTGVPSLSKTTIDNINGYVPSNPKEEELISTLFNQLDKSITLHQRKLNNLKLKKKALLQKLFPKNGKRYPELRFPGFTDAWEQRKLDNIAKIKTGGGTPKTTNLEYWSGDIPWIQSSDLVEGDVVHVNIKKFIDNNALKNSAAKLISRDSIALVTRVGVGKVAVINQDFTTSQDFLSLSDFDGNDIKFIAYQLFRLMQENAKVLQGTSIKGISKTDLIEQSIAIPNSIKEQNLIASLLSQTDSIITLHQRKLDHLQLQKKALLQQMFV